MSFTRTDGWAAVDLIRERGGGSLLFSFRGFLLPTEIRSKEYEEVFFIGNMRKVNEGYWWVIFLPVMSVGYFRDPSVVLVQLI